MIEIFLVKTGEALGNMRRASKSLCLEYSFGDKFVAVLYESMKGD